MKNSAKLLHLLLVVNLLCLGAWTAYSQAAKNQLTGYDILEPVTNATNLPIWGRNDSNSSVETKPTLSSSHPKTFSWDDATNRLKSTGSKSNFTAPPDELVLENTITTLDGTTYKGVTVQKINPDGLTIGYASTGGGIGVAKLKFENLPNYLQRRYGYNPDKAVAYEARQAQGRAEWLAEQRANAEIENRKKEELQMTVKAPPKATSVGVPVIGGGSGHWIKGKIDGGKIIQLEDGSLWQVSSLDVIDSALWLPLDNITVIDGDDPMFPYKLINTDEKELVDAKPLR